MSNKPFNLLVLKPAIYCNFRCPECTLRRDLHDNIRRDKNTKILTIKDWYNFIKSLQSFEYTKIQISGGEPTLYPYIVELFRYINDFGFDSMINTNGSNLDRKLAKELVDVGLKGMNISIPSTNNKELIDLCKPIDKTLNYIDIISNAIHATKEFSNGKFVVWVNTHLQNNNYKAFKDIFYFCLEHDVDYIIVNSLESTFDNNIENLKITKDNLAEFIHLLAELKVINYIDRKQLQRYTNNHTIRDMVCDKAEKYRFIVLANGDLHACNVIEYSHEPHGVVGNIFDNSIEEIIKSQKYFDFLKVKSKSILPANSLLNAKPYILACAFAFPSLQFNLS